MISRSNDPLSDFTRYELNELNHAKHLPTCSCCEERILQDTALYLPEYDAWICDRCIRDNRINVPEDMEW